MQAPEKILRQAWAWATAKCECRAETHGHMDLCGRPLEWSHRGTAIPGGWECRHRIPLAEGGSDDAENCMIVCWPCYSGTRSAASSPCHPAGAGSVADLARRGRYTRVCG